MPQSLSALYVHLVFSTKNRRPIFGDPAWRAEVHSYLGGISGRLGCPTSIVGGVADHVHILARQSKTMALSDWVRDLKSNSSNWIKTKPGHREFSWQAGFGAFSVDSRSLGEVRRYIQGQEEHHRNVSFEDEFRALLKEHDLEWDERYLWD